MPFIVKEYSLALGYLLAQKKLSLLWRQEKPRIFGLHFSLFEAQTAFYLFPGPPGFS